MSVLVVVDVALIFWLLQLLTPHIIVLEIYDTWIGAHFYLQKKCVGAIACHREAGKKGTEGRERVLPSDLNFQKISPPCSLPLLLRPFKVVFASKKKKDVGSC